MEKEGPIHVSNVMLVCPACGKPTRMGHNELPDGTQERARAAAAATTLRKVGRGEVKESIMMSRMQERYRKEVVPALMKHFG